MNFFKSVATTVKAGVSAAPKKELDAEFEKQQRQYFEVERVLQQLQLDLKKYSGLWGDLIAQQTKIFANLLYFYDKDNMKREIVDDLLRNMQLPMDSAVEHLARDLERDIQPVFHRLLTPFARVRNQLDDQKRKYSEFQSKQAAYLQLVAQTKRSRQPEWGPVAAAEESQRSARRDYESSTRLVRRAFRHLENQKTSMLDDVLGGFLNAQTGLFESMVTTCDLLRTKNLHLQYHLKYPSGIRDKLPPPSDVSRYVDARQKTPNPDEAEAKEVEALSPQIIRSASATGRTPPPPRMSPGASDGQKPRFPSADMITSPRGSNPRSPPPPPRRDHSPNTSPNSSLTNLSDVMSLRPRQGTLRLAPGTVMDLNRQKFYFYPRAGRHPLGMHVAHTLNFQFLHQLLDPACTRNMLDPNCPYAPNAVPTSVLSTEAANLS